MGRKAGEGIGMKYTICERAVWLAMFGPIKAYLKGQRPDWDIGLWTRRTRENYRAMIARTPDVGSLRQNGLRMCLSGGALWLSGYKAAEGQMDEVLFSGMVRAAMLSPLVKKSFSAKNFFTVQAQQKRKANADRANAIDSPFNWNTEVIPGRDAEELTILYHKCGLCALGRQEGCPELVPYMCQSDYISMDLMGGALYRTKTLATGGDCCDFYLCKKGSHWDTERRGGEKADE